MTDNDPYTLPAPAILTTAEVAKLLRVSPRTIARMRLEGRGPPYARVGVPPAGRVIYILSDVIAWVRSNADK